MFKKGWLAVVCLIAGFLAGCIVTNWRLSASYQQEKTEVVQTNANHFADANKQINESAKDYIGKSGELEKQIAELKKELAHAKKNHPVPADCRPDSGRLRVLKNAVRAANATAGQ
ncbi:DUF4094 domain-containing protein [Oxalobacter paraformigenes]|uniref:DUF4094 domain-containing protein n=1 Tax=Oxalobacter paraformigenes TaxID=556268 RepID=UPI00030504A4|nr:DUF4094 domain-containing protein [Oxalobacter paraformigenes]